MQAAIDDLSAIIRRRYPLATFTIEGDPEGSDEIFLVATVALEDLDEVTDLVIDRVLDLQLEQELPIHVLPVRPIERILAEFRAKAGAHLGAGASEPHALMGGRTNASA
jgi:hypothetical protein